MKKVLSILLAVVLVFGMLPATALNVFAAEETATLTFDNISKRKSGSTTQQVWEENGIVVTHGKGTGSNINLSYYNPIRFYANCTVTIAVAEGSKIKEIVVTCGSDTYANVWKSSIAAADANVTVSGSVATITPTAETNSFTVSKMSAQTRVSSIAVTYETSGGETPDPEPECTHPNKYEMTDGYAAECGKTGMTNSWYCPDCEETVTPQEEIPALTHNYVDGTCSVCGAAEPVAPEVVFPEIPETGNYELVTDINEITVGGEFVIVANYGDTNYAMNATTSGKPTATEVTVVDGKVAGDAPTWKLGSYDGGIVLFNGTEYLGYGTSGTNFSSSAEPYKWNVVAGENSTYQIISAAVADRAVTYQKNVQFGAYSTNNASGADYQGYLSLYKKVAGEVEVLTSTLTFMEQGTATKTETAEATKGYTMPEAVNAAPDGYTFAGWVEAQILEETAIAPETVYAAGDSYTVGNDVTFYALYTRTEVQSGGSATAYVAKNISEINDGDVVVITMTKDGTIYALPNNGGESTPSASETATVNSDGHLAANFDVVTWVISKDGDNLVFYVNGDSESWLYCLADNNKGVRVGDGAAKTFVVDAATGYLMNIETTSNRHIGVYQTQDWRCYKPSGSSVGNNIAGQTLAFYVKSSISGTVETDYYTTCVHNYASTSETTLTCQYCGTTKVAAASVNGTAYETVEQAIASAAGTVKLQAPVESVTVDGDLYLDVNGFSVESLTVTNGKLYGSDSKATVSAASGATVTVTGDVEMDVAANEKRYIALEDNGVYTFHVLEMKLSAVTLRANEECGIYYKATYACDDTLKGKINSYGVVFSLDNMPGADFKDETEDRNLYTVYEKDSFVSGATVTSGSIFGIMKEGRDDNASRGEMPIHANAYIEINGKNLVGTGKSYSLFDVMDKLDDDENWAKLKTDQQALIKQFYTDWYEAGMKNWSFSNITKIESA